MSLLENWHSKALKENRERHLALIPKISSKILVRDALTEESRRATERIREEQTLPTTDEALQHQKRRRLKE